MAALAVIMSMLPDLRMRLGIFMPSRPRTPVAVVVIVMTAIGIAPVMAAPVMRALAVAVVCMVIVAVLGTPMSVGALRHTGIGTLVTVFPLVSLVLRVIGSFPTVVFVILLVFRVMGFFRVVFP